MKNGGEEVFVFARLVVAGFLMAEAGVGNDGFIEVREMIWNDDLKLVVGDVGGD